MLGFETKCFGNLMDLKCSLMLLDELHQPLRQPGLKDQSWLNRMDARGLWYRLDWPLGCWTGLSQADRLFTIAVAALLHLPYGWHQWRTIDLSTKKVLELASTVNLNSGFPNSFARLSFITNLVDSEYFEHTANVEGFIKDSSCWEGLESGFTWLNHHLYLSPG